LLFNDAPSALLEKIEQVVRLIRSKGVGVYFVTQNPLDVPDTVLGQLGNRVQHALRAFTPRDQKAVKTAATTLRANPAIDVEKAITELAVGEALVSFLDEKGRPEIVERAFVLPPHTRIGPITTDERTAAIKRSPVAGTYEQVIDRESAYEVLKQRRDPAQAAPVPAPAPSTGAPAPSSSGGSVLGDVLGSVFGGGNSRRQSAGEAMVKSAARAIGSEVGRQIMRGVLGSILGGTSRRR
ncbi:MAG TPA: helicase HerA-like domain-containing protein, partial [Burkholderiales bacterium]|nr:helicase HerA-like domain-containing protein [Burkholderiales bacterium]